MTTTASIESAAAGRMQVLPTIIIVQGSFQTPKVYSKLVRGLVDQGYPTIHPQLPSCSDTDSPTFPQVDLIDDALAVRMELIRQIQYEGKTVVMVLHSYGGLVGSEAIPQELTWTARQTRGLPGGVIHLFFYSAYLLKEGQSVLSEFGESPNIDVKPDGRFSVLRGAQRLYNDLHPDVASLWASWLIPQSYRVQTTKLTRAAWRYVPSTFLICENDKAVPPEYQEMLAASAKSEVKRCDSGHSPHLSQPEMLVQKIHEASEKAVAGLAKKM